MSARATELARNALEAGGLPGLQAAVLRDGRIVWSVALGLANLEHSVPLTSDCRMRIGSISKSLTSAAVGLLVESGQLDLDVPVQTYVPEFPARSHPITTRQLGGHLSGIPHYLPIEIVNTTHYASVTEALDKFKDKEPESEPGEAFEYSSYGWNLIGAVIEGASGQPFLDFMEERVIAPLGLEDTMPDETREVIARRAQVYMVTPRGAFNPPAIDQSDAWPSGGYLSSAEDLVRFADAMWSGKLVKQTTIELLSSSQRTTRGEETGYGIGWQDQTLAGRRWSGHGGSHVGATADLWFEPQERLAIALITNTNTRALQDLLEQLAALF